MIGIIYLIGLLAFTIGILVLGKKEFKTVKRDIPEGTVVLFWISFGLTMLLYPLIILAAILEYLIDLFKRLVKWMK